MTKKLIKFILALVLAVLPCLTSGSISSAAAADIADYTAFPPFLPRVVSPNILFILDYSMSMVRPAYGDCDTSTSNCKKTFNNLKYDYSPSLTYAGYFENDAVTGKYNYTTTGTGVFEKNSSGSWNGNWLNWLAMTQFDVLKKVIVGGDVTPTPENTTANKIQSILDNSATVTDEKYRKIYKVVDEAACNANTGIPINVLSFCKTYSPQFINYKWIDPANYGVTPVTLTFPAVDDSTTSFSLPTGFDFKYYGRNITSFNISSNGFISPTNTNSYAGNGDLASTVYYDLIAAYWDDLYLIAGTTVKHFTIGTAPNRIHVISYNDIGFYDAVNRNVNISFQILLYETTNQIVFQYKDVKPATAVGAAKSATIGVNDVVAAGTIKSKSFIYNTGIIPNNNAVIANETALLATPDQVAIEVVPDSTKKTEIRKAATSLSVAPPAGYPVYIDVKTTTKAGGVCPAGFYLFQARDTCYDHVADGLLQEFRDGEMAGLLGFRLGIMELNSPDGGHVIKHFNENEVDSITLVTTGKKGPAAGWPSLMANTRNKRPQDDAPLSEALHMAQGYFREDASYALGLNSALGWSNDGIVACTSTGNNYDPYCFQSAAQKVPCAKSYALLVSSGNYSHDFGQNIYDTIENADKAPLSTAMRLTLGEVESSSNKKTRAFGGYLDNVAYQMHIPSPAPRDLRSDIDGEQTAALYAINTFGAGSGDGGKILKRAALYGGFKDADGDGNYDSEDANGNCLLDSGEDANSNGVIDGEDDCADPKTYFEASGGGDLRAKIVSAVTDILKNSASGTSVSVLSTSAGGEGALYQAYFYPARIENQKEDRKWPGFLRAFLLDTYQQLRDDYSGGTPDATLNTSNDRVAKMFLDDDTSEVKVNLYATPGKLAEPAPTPSEVVTMDNVASMWEGGTELAKSDKSGRRLYLWRDADSDGVVDNGDYSSITGEAMELVDSNAATLAPYLRAQGVDAATKTAEAAKIINFVRGEEIAGYRSRCITVPGATQESGCLASNQRVWPLGDIIFSTPTLVGAPAEKYNQIYGEASYFAFYNAYKNRRQVVYLGANDGMLHAFNAGSFNSTTISFADNPASGNGWTDPQPGLGDEIWAFLPHDNLPHLAWLTCNGTATDPATCGDSEYTHVYYVDHRPRVTDVRIFNNTDSDGVGEDTSYSEGIAGQANVAHPNGWGSILIMPMRLGGGAIKVDLNGDGDTTDTGESNFNSAYYAFDVTDPEKPPKLLWRFSYPGLGFTTSYPAIVRIDSNGPTTGGTIKWFMVVGSGPQNDEPIAGGKRDYGMDGSYDPTNADDRPGTTQAGKVFVVDLTTGVVEHTEQFVDNYGIMGDPIAVDVNFDFTTDVLYIGSVISGNTGRIFRINTKQDPVPANWEYSTLFDPNPLQSSFDPDVPTGPVSGKYEMGPLLVSPSVSMDRFGNLWVYFGSGRLKNLDDLTDSRQQLFYGIKDKCWQDAALTSCTADAGADSTYALADLYNSSAVAVTTSTDAIDQVGLSTSAGTTTIADVCGAGAVDEACDYKDMITQAQTKKGWYVTLDNPAGASERVLARSSVIGGLVLFTTYTPAGDICSIFGNSKLYAVYYETGTASNSPVVEGAAGIETVGTKTLVRPSIDLGAGMPTSVGIAIGETVSGFVQKSTGEIIRIEATPALKVRSSISGWRETTGNTGNAGVETIYEHIVK